MNFDQAIDGDRGTATIAGDLDIYAAAELKERLVALCAELKELELNLTATGLIDTAGLQLLLAARRALEIKGGALRVNEASETCTAALELAGMGAETGGEVA